MLYNAAGSAGAAGYKGTEGLFAAIKQEVMYELDLQLARITDFDAILKT